MNLRTTVVCAVFVTLWASGAAASSMVPHTLEERVERADRVVLAQVTEQHTVNQGTAEKPRLVTFTQVVVGDDLKGQGPAQIQIQQLGGKWGLWEQHVEGDATLEVGETAVLFLRCTSAQRCTVSNLRHGKFRVIGGDVEVSDMFTNARTLQRAEVALPKLRQLGGSVPKSPAAPVTPSSPAVNKSVAR